MRNRPGLRKLGRRGAGVLFLAVLSALAMLSVLIYQKTFTSAVMVTLRTDRVGNQLHESSEVKARGVVVGEVRRITATGSGANVLLALEPEQAGKLPQDVVALLVPKTLFGERYVQLSIPDSSVAPPIADGDVITQDRSANAIELEQVYDDLLPVLEAVQPHKLAAALTAVSTALDGRGDRIGNALVTAADYLEEFNPSLPKLNENIRDLGKVSELYGDIAPDLLDALTDSAVTMDTVAEKREELSGLYARVTSSAQDVTVFLRNNKHNIIQLAATSRAPLEVAAEYSPSFPCTLEALTALKPSMDRVLGAGTGKPGLHVTAEVTQSRGKYLPGVDDPVYNASGGPHCYPSGVAPRSGLSAVAPGAQVHPLLSSSDGELGLPNSPQEQELLATLLAPELGVAVADVADWSSVLVGPLYRGTEVRLS